jgi:peptide/nickel transport system substrate-binding protein
LVLPELPGLPAAFPLLHTLDAWPGLRADLTAVVGMSAVLLTVVGLLLALVVPTFPWEIGLGAAGLAGLVLVGAALAQPVRLALETQWRDARKPVSAVTSALLSLVVVVTTLFITKPPIFIGPKHLGYDFSYTYHQPPHTHTGDAITIGLALPLLTLAPWGVSFKFQPDAYLGLWQSCLAQLPDTSLELASYQPDQCTEVPTIQNGGESLDGRTTIFHIDARAVWSDGMPITADDFLFAQQLLADPNVDTFGYSPSFYTPMRLTEPDPRTVAIHWPVQYGDYLAALAVLPPMPWHVYATGKFAGVYNPRTGAYNSTLAQALLKSPGYDTTIPVDNGPFTVKCFVPNDHAVLVRNPRFFSNFFHAPALDQVTLVSAVRDFAALDAQGKFIPISQLQGDMIARYRQGGLDEVEGLVPIDLSRLDGIPAREVVTSPDESFIELAFNQRRVAPNARANGGASMFTGPTVRRAFVEAFDRCGAVRALLGIRACTDPNVFSDELTAPPAPDFDPTFKLPAYNPTDAARLLDRAGYPVVDGVRRAKDGVTPLQLSLALSFSASDSAALALRMQQDYARALHVGVTITSNVPYNPFYQTGAFDLTLFAQGNSPDPVGSLLGQGAGWESADTWFGLIDPQVVAQDQLGSEAIDSQARATVYRALQRYVSGLLDIVPVYMTADTTLTKPTLCNYKHWPAFGSDLWNLADWYVAPSCPS